MKKTLSLLLALLMLAALTVPTFAAEQLGKNSTTIKTTIPGIADKPVLDGFVDEFEYGEIAFTTDDMRIYGPDDTYINQIKGYDFAIHAAYSSDTVYLAVVVESPDYAQTQTDAASIWKDWSPENDPTIDQTKQIITQVTDDEDEEEPGGQTEPIWEAWGC